jgi:hypothetical protein
MLLDIEDSEASKSFSILLLCEAVVQEPDNDGQVLALVIGR